ncbi:PREDICTED: ninja-family protein AFP1-like [Camelina sativa]|uniref:Ninja-family protein n=1 Tax=Camelina sativa TaxID=90675 RepID=A0ABM0W1F0_CAMSA|nr:PREDICTED: ninja-family protein AFP1-like [Camelina sativa]
METKFGKNEDVEEVELELCLSLGGPFKKTEKSKPVEQFNAVGCTKDTAGVNLEGGATMNVRSRKETRKKREPKLQQRSGVCKKIRTECNGVPNGVDLDLSFSKMGNGYMSSQLKETSKDVTIWSPICTSSDVSDPSSSSRQEGGSCDFGAQSDQTKPVRPPVNNMQSRTEETVHSTDGSKDAVVVETTQEWSNSVTKNNNTGKPPKPYTNSNGDGSMLPFAQMPCVTSTGNGPDGKTVNGFLYRYSKSEISIICVCHGTSFSPAEFIVHAGGTNVSHPLRHITVVPSTF